MSRVKNELTELFLVGLFKISASTAEICRLGEIVAETATPDAIRAQMARIRNELQHDVDDVVEQAKQMADWRHFVSKHPWLSLGAAAAVGFMVVPNRLRVLSPDAETLEKLAKTNRLVVKPQPQVQRQSKFVAPLLNVLLGAVLRNAMTMAGQEASKIWAMKVGDRGGHNEQ